MPETVARQLEEREILSRLEEEAAVCEEVLRSSRSMQKALLDHQVGTLWEATGEHEALVARLNELEQERVRVYPGTLSELMAEISPSLAVRAESLRRRLTPTLTAIKDLNFQNASLLLSALQVNQTLLEGLVTAEEHKRPYGPPGAKLEHEPKELFLNRRA